MLLRKNPPRAQIFRYFRIESRNNKYSVTFVSKVGTIKTFLTVLASILLANRPIYCSYAIVGCIKL